MSCAPRYSSVLIPVILLTTTFGTVDAPTGKIEMRWLFPISPSDKLPFP